MADTPMMMDRRGVLGIAGGAMALGMPGLSRPPRIILPTPRRRAHNIIFMVPDGMSIGTFTMADMMREVQGLGPSHWRRLWSRPDARRAMCTTYPADGWVTDSAAAASAWGIGRKVDNGAINFTPDGKAPEPIGRSAMKLGKTLGLVSTTRITHATPAAFVANVPKREFEPDIAEQILARGVSVALGGGSKYVPDDLLAKHSDVRVVRTADELLSARTKPGRLLGLFSEDHCPYEIERPASVPSLRSMSLAALDVLGAHSDGFVLLIEGGRVDHGAHANDAVGMIFDQIEFDNTVGAVVDWIGDRDDTLLIISTDHANANPGLTFYGQAGRRSFELLASASHSFDWIVQQFRSSDRTIESLVETVSRATGIVLTDEERLILERSAIRHEPVDPFDPANGTLMVLGSLLANHTGVAFLSPNHTPDFVEVTAIGPGAETMPAMIDNTDLHGLMMNALAGSAQSITPQSITP